MECKISLITHPYSIPINVSSNVQLKKKTGNSQAPMAQFVEHATVGSSLGHSFLSDQSLATNSSCERIKKRPQKPVI